MHGAEITPVYGKSIYYRVFVQAPGQAAADVTIFRNAPTQVGQMTSSDPFGDATLSLSFPAITVMDRPGTGDLSWLVPNANVDVLFYDADGKVVRRWEGYYVSEDFGTEQGITCKGALYQADDFLAKPSFPIYPIPYEMLIRDALSPTNNPSLRTKPLKIVYPDGWATVVPTYPDDKSYLRPWGVAAGDLWTGFTTRSTGSWDPSLTGHVQSLLGVMWTDTGGQWTVSKLPGRQPVLRVREALMAPNEKTLVVYAGVFGVEVKYSRDFTQSANVVFVQGTDLSGSTYSGMQVTSDGKTTYYDPFAASPTVFPSASTNPNLIPEMMRKEQVLKLPNGIDALAARDIAAHQIRRYADPGMTGSIKLQTDPMVNGVPVSRFLIEAGDTIMVRGLRGTDVLFHIAAVSIDFSTEVVSLTVDTKFRDALTVHEVRARTRDALDPVRLLQVGRYSNTIQDLLKPWSYADGSGVIPSGGAFDATPLLTQQVGNTEPFPWQDTTRRFPPKTYPQYYIRIPGRDADANNNWSGVTRDGLRAAAIPIKMSQSGTIRLSQIAAYDADGNVKPVYFHVGIYGSSGVNPLSMPTMPATSVDSLRTYPAGQHYPFFAGAFEQYKPDGTQQSDKSFLPADGIDQAIAWGNFYEPAGYSPGRYSSGNGKTGLLVDETSWSFDTSSQPGFDKYNAANVASNPTAGFMYVMIYCDDSGSDTYFMGRLWRTEPGA